MISIIGTAAVVLVVMYAGLGWWSHQPRFGGAGLTDGRLASCPASPNCVCSEADAGGDEGHAIAALDPGAVEDDQGWSGTVEAVRAMGGRVEADTGRYLHATFVSRIFRFVDDLELRMDGERVQVRSASRVGYSDLGVNRRRVEALRDRLRAGL